MSAPALLVTLNTEAYELHNGHAPRGRGLWVFLLGKRTERGGSVTTSSLQPWFSNLGTSYRVARDAAFIHAARNGFNYAELLWTPNVVRVATIMMTTVAEVGAQYKANAAQMRGFAKLADRRGTGRLWLGRCAAEWNARALMFENAAQAAERIASKDGGTIYVCERRKFATLKEAQALADKYFKQRGVVVAITTRTKGARS